MAEPAFLIDSNICIYVLADAQSGPARRLAECRTGTVVTSAIVYAEVMRGLTNAGASDLGKAERFFELVPVLPFDADAARAYRTLPFKRGRFDRLIAAHALSLGLTVVTSNRTDFADVRGLSIESWSP